MGSAIHRLELLGIGIVLLLAALVLLAANRPPSGGLPQPATTGAAAGDLLPASEVGSAPAARRSCRRDAPASASAVPSA